MSLDLDLWGRCLLHRNNDNLKGNLFQVSSPAGACSHGWPGDFFAFRTDHYKGEGRGGEKKFRQGKMFPQQIHARDGPAFSH